MRWFGRRREAREAELDEEIRSHFRMAVEDRVARGESRSGAERAVRREFGNVLEVKEVTRAAWGGLFGERLAQDVRYAVRSLKRTPAFTIVAVLTLALGVGATTAVFTVVNGVLLRPLPFPDPDRLVLVEHSPPPSPFLPTPGMSDRDYVALRENGTVFERVTTFSNRPIALTGGGEPARLNAGVVTTEFFDVLGVPPLLGRGFAAEEDEPGRDDVVVLGDALWRSRFAADSGVIGASVTVDGVPKTVSGVMPPGLDFPNGAELWTPLAMRIDPGNSMIRSVVGRLKRDATLQQSHAAFSAFVRGLARLPSSSYESSVQMQRVHDRVLAGVSTLPAASAAGAVNWLPLDRWVLSGDFAAEGVDDPTLSYWADKVGVSPDYFRAMGIRLLRGRGFTAADGPDAPRVAIVSRSLANRIWPDGDAIGRRLAVTPQELTPEDWLTVVGVVDDVLQREITGDRSAAIYQPYSQVDWPFFLGHMNYVVRSTDNPRSIARAMRDVVHSADPSLPVHTVRSMDEVVASTTQEPLFQTWLLATFSMIALALAAVGVYGVLAYAVTQRRFEIGVRMALGARAADVMASVLGRTLALTLAGVVLGALGALAATRALRRFLFEVTPTDPVTFMGAAALICSAALLAGWLPARRAARVEPIAVLRSE